MSAHIFHRAEGSDIVRELIAPFIADQCRPQGRRWFYLRYWNGGPHLRLRCAVDSSSDRETLWDELQDAAGAFFLRFPSPELNDEDAYLAASRTWALLENTPMEPNLAPHPGTELRIYAPEFERYGSGASLRAVEKHFWESSEIALGILDAHPPATALNSFALRAIALTAFLSENTASAHRWGAIDLSVDQAVALHEAVCDVDEVLSKEKTGPPSKALALWAVSIGELRKSITGLSEVLPHAIKLNQTETGRPITSILELASHLLLNRLGIDIDRERTLRRIVASARSTR